MSRFLCDTNVLIASACSWHAHHVPSLREINRRAQAGQEFLVAAHSLVELYSVLTRIPHRRLLPSDAVELIRLNCEDATIVTLPRAETWNLLNDAAERHMRGGQTYDALTAHCAIRGRATTLLTWNVRHFAAFGSRIQVLRPRR